MGPKKQGLMDLLTGIIIFWGCLAIFPTNNSFSLAERVSLNQKSASPRWWEVTLELEVEGAYLCRQDGRPIEGKFNGAFLWQGTMEPDEPDVILYHLRCDVLRWEVKEREGESESFKAPVASSISPPNLSVITFARQENSFLLDFILESMPIPFSLSLPRCELILPSSATHDQRLKGIRYNEHLRSGSNRLVVPIEEIARHDFQETFTWTWSFPSNFPPPRNQEFGTYHRVVTRLKVRPHFAR